MRQQQRDDQKLVKAAEAREPLGQADIRPQHADDGEHSAPAGRRPRQQVAAQPSRIERRDQREQPAADQDRVAEVDHGSETATATASQSATRSSRARRKRGRGNWSSRRRSSTRPKREPQRHVLAVARDYSVAVLFEQREHVGFPEAARILDQDELRQQRRAGRREETAPARRPRLLPRRSSARRSARCRLRDKTEIKGLHVIDTLSLATLARRGCRCACRRCSCRVEHKLDRRRRDQRARSARTSTFDVRVGREMEA